MALKYSSDKITNKSYLPSAAPHSARETYVDVCVALVSDPLLDNALVGLLILPANCIPVGFRMICESLADAALVFDVGILNADGDDLVPNSNLVTASTVGVGGGIAYMNDPKCVWKPATWLAEATCPDINVEKTIVMKVTTPATNEAEGSVYARLRYRAAENGV